MLTIRFCCIMLWRSVLPCVCFSVHSTHALQLLDARRTKVCPYVCTTCRVHNIESPVCCVFSDTWPSLCTYATSDPPKELFPVQSPFSCEPSYFPLKTPLNYKEWFVLFSCSNRPVPVKWGLFHWIWKKQGKCFLPSECRLGPFSGHRLVFFCWRESLNHI